MRNLSVNTGIERQQLTQRTVDLLFHQVVAVLLQIKFPSGILVRQQIKIRRMDHPVQAKRRHADTARHVLQGDIGKRIQSASPAIPLRRKTSGSHQYVFEDAPGVLRKRRIHKTHLQRRGRRRRFRVQQNVHVRISVDIAGEYKLLKADNVHIVVIVKSRRAGNRIILIRIYNAKSHLSGIGNTLQIDSERFETRRDIIIVDSVRNTEFAVLYISADFNVCLFCPPAFSRQIMPGATGIGDKNLKPETSAGAHVDRTDLPVCHQTYRKLKLYPERPVAGFYGYGLHNVGFEFFGKFCRFQFTVSLFIHTHKPYSGRKYPASHRRKTIVFQKARIQLVGLFHSKILPGRDDLRFQLPDRISVIPDSPQCFHYRPEAARKITRRIIFHQIRILVRIPEHMPFAVLLLDIGSESDQYLLQGLIAIRIVKCIAVYKRLGVHARHTTHTGSK